MKVKFNKEPVEMNFKVLKVDDVGIKNGFYIGEIFKGTYEVMRDRDGNITFTLVFDPYNNRGIDADWVEEV